MAMSWIPKMQTLYSFLFLSNFLLLVLLIVFNSSLLDLISKDDSNTFPSHHDLVVHGFLEKPSTQTDRSPKQSNTQTDVSITLATHLLSMKHDSNIVFSPLSIRVVLNLIAAGSSGQTQDQLLAFLKTNTTDDLNSYSQLVSSVLADGGPNGGPRLSFVNGVWLNKIMSLKPSFEQVLENVYKATLKHFNFQNKVEMTNEVNLWAEKETSGLIKEVIHVDAIYSSTMLIFTNAVYFKGAWHKKFDQSKTKESDFHLLDDSKVQVPFMTSKADQFVSEYDDFKVLGLPYDQGQDKRQFTMYFVLPNAKDDLQPLVEKIRYTPDFFEHHIPHQKVKVGQLLIPKFKISFGFEASDMLKELGLPLNIALTEMVNGQSLYTLGIHHKSFVEVNEEGTKAATISMMADVLCMDVDFVADHPFLFVIREDVTGVVLFMGHVINPSLH